ncbi:hypothetical protein ES703_91364 [subsurface metagenome]
MKRKGRSEIMVINKNSGIAMHEPLILLDWTTVLDHQKLLALPADKIVKIEVVNDRYIKGDISYGGIVYIESKDGDMAGYELPENSYFFDYRGLEHQENIVFPGYDTSDKRMNIPDFRNCLFWQPDLPLNPGQHRNIEFYTADVTGDYILVIRGIADDGSLMEWQFGFTVD